MKARAPDAPEMPDEDSRLLMAYAGTLALIGTFAGVFGALGNAAAITDDAVHFFTATAPGRFLLAQNLLLASAGVLFLRSARTTGPGGRPASTGLLAAAGALACTTGVSHAAASIHLREVAVAANLVHMAAASVWVGGVVGLGLWLPGRPCADAGRAIRAFGPWAMVAVAVLAAAGIVHGVLRVGTPAALLGTVYGATVFTKVLLLLGLGGLGWFHRTRVAQRLARQPGTLEGAPRTIWVEAGLMFLALLAAGLLASLAPPQ